MPYSADASSTHENRMTPVRPLWWKANDAPVYFLGSIHLGPPGGFSHGAAVLHAFDQAEKVYFEVTRHDLDTIPALIRREAGSLREDLGPDLYHRLVNDPRYNEQFEGIKLPFVVTELAAQAYHTIGLTHDWGVEKMLYERAAGNGQPIGGLESAADQVRSLASFSPQRIASGMKTILDQPDLVTQMRDLIVEGYLRGDLNTMNAARGIMHKLYPDVADCLLTAREARWAPQLRAIVEAGRPVMVVVGALHLAGANNILADLNRAGVAVSPCSEDTDMG